MSTITAVNELDLSRWVFKSGIIAPRLWSELKLPSPSQIHFAVSDPIIDNRQEKPGDIDVLVCALNQPNLAVAFECKRLRIKPETFQTLQIGGLPGLDESIHQVRGLRRIGFSRCFLLVFMAVDGHEQVNFSFLDASPTPSLIQAFDRALDKLPIDPEIGMVCIELVQPTVKDFCLTGGSGVRVLRPAGFQSQPATLTKRIEALLAQKQL